MAGVETHREEDGHISVAVPAADLNAPPLVEMQRQDQDGHTPPAETQRAYSRKMSISYLGHLWDRLEEEMRGLGKELCDGKTYLHCLGTCSYFFFCHAFASLILNLTVCCRCCSCLILETPDCIEERTGRMHKVVAFLAKILSSLWVSSLVILFVRWVIFQPLQVKPHLAASTVYEFELQSHQLRFNITTGVLFHNMHSHYKIRHHYFAATLVYADTKLGPVDDDELPSFTQKPHESTLKLLGFVGRLRNASGTVVEETLVRERLEGLLQLVVRIRVLFSYGFWPFKGDYFTIFDCPLQSPFPHKDDPTFSLPTWCKPVD